MAKSQDGLLLFTPWKSQNGLMLFTPWQNQTNSEEQEETNSRVKMGKESKCTKGQDGFLFFTSWQSQTSSEQQEKTNSRVKMGKESRFLLFPPERVKLTVNSKKETNSRVKMGQRSSWASVIYPLKESKWGKGHYRLLLFTPWQSQTNSEQQGQNGPRVKIGFCYLPPERVKMGFCCLPPDRVKLTEQQEKRKGRIKLGQKESSWAWPILTRSQIGPRSQDGSEHYQWHWNCELVCWERKSWQKLDAVLVKNM